jgi:hypothetical protein
MNKIVVLLCLTLILFTTSCGTNTSEKNKQVLLRGLSKIIEVDEEASNVISFIGNRNILLAMSLLKTESTLKEEMLEGSPVWYYEQDYKIQTEFRGAYNGTLMIFISNDKNLIKQNDKNKYVIAIQNFRRSSNPYNNAKTITLQKVYLYDNKTNTLQVNN